MVRTSRSREVERLRSLLTEREAQLEKLSREREALRGEVERLRREVEALRGEASGVPGIVTISLPRGAADLIWRLLRAEEVTELVSGPITHLELKVGDEKLYVQRTDEGLLVYTGGTLVEALRENPGKLRLRVPPASEPLPRGLREALARNLAQFFVTLDLRHKVVLFLMNLLPLMRQAGIEVGDEAYVHPFEVLVGRASTGEEVRLPIYTPEQLMEYWGGVDVGDAHFSGRKIARVMLEFWGYALRQLAAKHPDVVARASGIAESLRKLPKTSLARLGKPAQPEEGETGEVEEE